MGKRSIDLTVKQAVKEFAKVRDGLAERAEAQAAGAFSKQFDPNALMVNPVKYLRFLFVKLGMQVVREMKGEAEKAGEKHAIRYSRHDTIDTGLRGREKSIDGTRKVGD